MFNSGYALMAEGPLVRRPISQKARLSENTLLVFCLTGLLTNGPSD